MTQFRNITSDIEAMTLAKEVSQHLKQNDGHLINCVSKPLLSPENAALLDKATQDAVTPRHIQPGAGRAAKEA